MTETPRLYLIAPLHADAALLPRLEAALDAGDVACLQLPEADPADLQPLIEAAQARDVAALVRNDMRPVAEADGVHLDSPAGLAQALRQLRPGRIVGVSGLAMRDDAMAAGEAGVDYVMFGEASPGTPTLPFAERRERVAWWAEIFQVPCVAVAHHADEIAPLADDGADFVALPGSLWADAPDPARAVRAALEALRDGAEARLAREAEQA